MGASKPCKCGCGRLIHAKKFPGWFGNRQYLPKCLARRTKAYQDDYRAGRIAEKDISDEEIERRFATAAASAKAARRAA